MGVLQSNYSDTIAPGFPGQIANSEPRNIISRTAASIIAFGALALQGPAAHKAISATAETVEASAPAAQAGNTGNGTFAATPTITAGTAQGAYRVEITAAAANAGNFVVEGPNGIVGAGVVGVAFNQGGVAFTLNDGATDFAVGDGFTFNIAATAGTAVGDILGIATLDTTVGSETTGYPVGYTLAIMTRGAIWVTVGGAVAERDPVYFVPSTGRYVNADGAGRHRIPNAEFDTAAAANGDVATVILHQRNAR